MIYNAPHFKLGLVTALVAALVACGGGGAGSGVVSNGISTTVMDGLISNALVCVDTNNNGACDTGEIQGRTDSKGKVTLNVPAEQIGSARLVAMIGTDAIDLDTGPVTTAYTLQTPAGKHDVISPLTTMVQAKMDADKVGSDTAEAQVKAQMGLTVSVFDDYIAMRGKSAAHTKADVMARLLVVSAKKSKKSKESCDLDAEDSASDKLKESRIRSNLLAKLSDFRAASDQVLALIVQGKDNFAKDYETEIENLSPEVKHCTSLVAQTITFAKPTDKFVGVAANLVATASSALPVAFTSTTTPVCTVSGVALTLLKAGSCAITASQAGNANFAAAPPVSQSFMVTATATPTPLTAQTITFSTPASLTLGATTTLTASASSGLPVVLAASPTSICTLNGSILTPVSSGTCTVTANQAGNSTYAAAGAVSRAVAVSAAPITPTAQTITFAQPAAQIVGIPATLTVSASSNLAVTLASTTPTVCSVVGSTKAVTLVAAGNCTISADQAGNTNYAAAAQVSRTFAVSAAAVVPSSQTITFNTPTSLSQTVGVAATLGATASSGLTPVTFATTSTGICSVNNTMLTLIAPGSCIVTASQAGNASFAAAAQVSRTFVVAAAVVVPASQTITFTGPGNQTMGTATPALSATATSGLSVAFASSTTGICTVSGTTLTLVAAGSCTITATQAGNTGYAAASAVSSTFTVAAAPAATGSATAGKALYTGNACFACHGTPPSKSKILNGANLTTLTNSFKSVSDMQGYSFTAQQLLDLNAYLKTPNI